MQNANEKEAYAESGPSHIRTHSSQVHQFQYRQCLQCIFENHPMVPPARVELAVGNIKRKQETSTSIAEKVEVAAAEVAVAAASVHDAKHH